MSPAQPGKDPMAVLAEQSEWARAHGRRPTAHRYGDDPDQVADLLLPDGTGPYPVAVLLHGGFWRPVFTYGLMEALALGLAARGWATWNVEYRRRVPHGGASSAALSDVRAALSLLREVQAPVDLQRSIVVGHSAGGHLALCVAGVAQANLVVSLAGVCDLVSAAEDHLGADAAVAFIGATPAQDPDAYAAANPMARLPTGARTLLVHGDADDRVPISQSRRYLAAARRAGDPCELLELPGEDHFALIDPRTAAFAAWADHLPSRRDLPGARE